MTWAHSACVTGVARHEEASHVDGLPRRLAAEQVWVGASGCYPDQIQILALAFAPCHNSWLSWLRAYHIHTSVDSAPNYPVDLNRAQTIMPWGVRRSQPGDVLEYKKEVRGRRRGSGSDACNLRFRPRETVPRAAARPRYAPPVCAYLRVRCHLLFQPQAPPILVSPPLLH